jgi:hypothetical protein
MGLLTAAAAATTIASSFLLGSLLMVLVGLNLAYAQIPEDREDDDLTQTTVPEFDFNNANKSTVVLLNFTALNKAEFVAVGVSYGPPHSNIGNPPLLRVQIYDYNGAIIQQFNYWHPLFALEFQEDGKEYLKMLPNAVGRFVFPFDPNAALMKVSYLHHEGANNTWPEEVISVDLRPTIPSFCDQFPKDPDCRSSDLAVVDVSTANGTQQLPILVGKSADVTVQTTVTNNGPDKPIGATLSSRTITTPGSHSGVVIVTPAAGATPNENGAAATTTTISSLSQRQQHDQTYTIECWEPGKYNIIFESEVASLSGAVVDDNQLNNKGQLNLEVDCSYIGVLPGVRPPHPLGVSIEANATEDGSPPTTIEFRAITGGGTQPHKFRWNFDDDGSSNNSNNNDDVKGGELMTHQFGKLGQYNVTVTVTDSANGFRGQTASDNVIVTISDKVPPQVIVPSHIIAEAKGPEGANVTFTVSATDIVDGSVPVSCQAQSGGQVQSGDTFELGTTNVECQATDSSGNSATGTFTVTVQDTRPPVITVPPPIIAEAKGPEGANVTFTVSATDIVDGSVPVSCQAQSGGQVQSGDTFELGTTNVNCYAEDSSHNRVGGNFPVTVQDTTPPKLELPSNLPPVEATGPEGANFTFLVRATDVVDGKATLGKNGVLIQEDRDGRDIRIWCDPATGSEFLLNVAKTVNCYAEDSSHNRVGGNFPVTVQDTTPPILIVPPSIYCTVTPNSVSCSVTSPAALPLNSLIVPVQANSAQASTATSDSLFVRTPPPPGIPVKFSVAARDTVDGFVGLGEDGHPMQDRVGRDIRIWCDPATGSEFLLNQTEIVNCYAEDSSHNRVGGNFPVTVQGTRLPPLVFAIPPPTSNQTTTPPTSNQTTPLLPPPPPPLTIPPSISDQPTDEEPTDEEPTDEEPTDEEPTDEEPTDEEPTDEEPTDEEPTD